MRIAKIWWTGACILIAAVAACGGSDDESQKTGPEAVNDTTDAGSSGGDSCSDTSVLDAARAKCVSEAAPVDGPFAEGEAAAYCQCLYERWAAKLSCDAIAGRDFQPVSDPDQCYCMEEQRPYCDTSSASEQTVQCQSSAQGMDSVYLLTRNADGSADVSCNASTGSGTLISNEAHFDAGSDDALLAHCTLSDFPTSGATMTFQRIETDLEQPVEDPATVVHGGVSVDIARADGTHTQWTMGDADPARNLAGECTDSTGN